VTSLTAVPLSADVWRVLVSGIALNGSWSHWFWRQI